MLQTQPRAHYDSIYGKRLIFSLLKSIHNCRVSTVEKQQQQ